MKTFKISYLLLLAGLFAVLLLVSSCSDSSTGPSIDDTTHINETIDDDGPGDPIDPPPSDNFKIDSDDVTETDDGFRFDGTLIGVNEESIEFSIGEGEFSVVLDENDDIISISGVGIPEFPDIGIFKDILEEFAWNRIEAHIEYKRGFEFLNERDSGIPLNPDRFYLSYRVFDESKDGNFELRGRANDFLYGLFDVYIDVRDPAVFFKIKVPMPDASKDKADGAVKSFWEKVAENAKKNAIPIGESIFEVDNDTYLIVGFSNEGTFKTPEYELTEFGLLDPILFHNLNGFENLPALPSNIYLKFARFPVPGTYSLLNLTGDMSAYSENGNKIVPLDLLMNRVNFSRTESYTGDIFLNPKGLALILDGILPAFNEYTGRDLFGEDIDIAPIQGFLQYQAAVPGINPAFFRFGGSFGTSLVTDIFGPELRQYLFSPPGAKMFGYFNVGPELDDLTFYAETRMRMVIPGYGEVDLNNSILNINSEGIYFNRKNGLEIGPINRTTELEGSIYNENYNARAVVINDITLPNDVVLGNRELELTVSSDSGASVRGQIILPFSIGEAAASGKVTHEGVTMSGMLSAGSKLALNTGLDLPTKDFEFTVSTDPNRILELRGDTHIPFIGYNHMTGIINKDHFFFDGEIDRTLSFGNLDVPISNGKLRIDSNQGVFLDGYINIPHLGSAEMEGEISSEQIRFSQAVNRTLPFSGVSLPISDGTVLLNNQGASLSGDLQLPANLRTASVSGSITQNSMHLTGSMSNSLTFHGVNFPISNSTVTASTNDGVSAVFTMNLFRFSPRLRGSISPGGNFTFTGSNSFSRSINAAGQSARFRGDINTQLSNSGIQLTGSGTISYTGVLGNTHTIASGPINFRPNWSARTVEACISGYCVNI